MKIRIHEIKHNWYKYIKPKRLTLKQHPPIYKWLWFTIELDKQEYQKLKHKQGQNTFCYCPVCNNELISSNSFVKDTDYVYFKCTDCEATSKWDFDFMCPILVDCSTLQDKER